MGGIHACCTGVGCLIDIAPNARARKGETPNEVNELVATTGGGDDEPSSSEFEDMIE